MKRILLWAPAALLLVAPPALADVKAGVDAWSRGDYAAAVREWQGPASQGDPDAQFNLAQAYKSGRGVPRDLARAETLFGAAAAQGHMQAADNYGLLLYQRGEHAAAMPYVSAAAARGDPRAQYYLGIAHFNGDYATKDWVLGYALVSIAHQSGIEAATRSLAEMDQLVPLAQRQQAVALSAQITADAEATRARQLAAVDLGGGNPVANTPPIGSGRASSARLGENVVTAATRIAGSDSPRTAGADYARPALPPAVATPAPKPQIAVRPAPVVAKPSSAPQVPRQAAPAATAAAQSGPWRIQLGAFAVAGNADALWSKLKGRPELAGHPRILDKGAKVTRLLAGGFASPDAAQSACRKLAAAGASCLVTKN